MSKTAAFARLMATLDNADSLETAQNECCGVYGRELELVKSDPRGYAAFTWLAGQYAKERNWVSETRQVGE